MADGKWQMEFNLSKCKIMCFTTRRDPPKREYVFCGEILVEAWNVTLIWG